MVSVESEKGELITWEIFNKINQKRREYSEK